MSSYIPPTIIPSTTSGNQLAALLNSFRDSIISGFSGTSRPAGLLAGGTWIDITNDSTGIWDFKFYDGIQDIILLTINKSTGLATFSSADSLLKVNKTSPDIVGPIVRMIKKRVANSGQVMSDDSIGEIQFYSTDNGGIEMSSGRIKSVASEDHTPTARGAYFVFELAKNGSNSVLEVMRLMEGKLGVGVTDPKESLHILGSSKLDKIGDDVNGPKQILSKKRLSTGVLEGDVLGTVEYRTEDSSNSEYPAAQIEASANEDHSSSNQGSKVVIRNKKKGSNAYTDQVIIEDNVKVPDLEVNKIVAKRVSDDIECAETTFKKARATGSGQTVTSDIIGRITYKGTDGSGNDVELAQVDVIAREVTTGSNQGAQWRLRNKKLGENVFTDQIVIGEGVYIKDLNVDNFHATQTELGTITEVEDASLLVNKGGTKSNASANVAGIEVEMTDGPEYRFGYSELAASRFVAGYKGIEKEVVNVDDIQILSNKSLVSPSLSGTPTSPTPPLGDSSNRIATTEFVTEAMSGATVSDATTTSKGVVQLAGDLGGTADLPTVPGLSSKAPLASPAFSGVPTAPTPATADNSTTIATTAYVKTITTPVDVAIAALDIDWSLGDTYYKSITVTSTFTFSNTANGRVISVFIKNTSGASVNVAFPAGYLKPADLVLAIAAGQENIYTFAKSNGKIYVSYVVGLT